MYYPGQKNWDNRAHVAQARDLSSMHAPMFGLRACLNFFGQGSTCIVCKCVGCCGASLSPSLLFVSGTSVSKVVFMVHSEHIDLNLWKELREGLTTKTEALSSYMTSCDLKSWGLTLWASIDFRLCLKSIFCPILKPNTPLQRYCNELNEDDLFARIRQEMAPWQLFEVSRRLNRSAVTLAMQVKARAVQCPSPRVTTSIGFMKWRQWT